MLRIAVVAITSRAPYGNNLKPAVRAFAALGSARLFDPAEDAQFAPTGAGAPAPLSRGLIEDIGSFAPHVVVCLGGATFVPDPLRPFLPSNPVLVGIAQSDPQALPASLAIAAHFDLFYTQDEGSLAAYERQGVAAHFLPLAADPDTLFPVPGRPTCDLLYFGKWTAYRHELLCAVARAARVRIIAYRGETRWDVPTAPQCDDELALCREINGARLVLDPTRSELCSNLAHDAYRITPRSFMAAACAVPALVEERCPLEGLFTAGKEIVTFDGTPAGAAAAVGELLADEPRRRAIGKAARHRLLASHTWLHRSRRILDDVAALLRRSPHRLYNP